MPHQCAAADGDRFPAAVGTVSSVGSDATTRPELFQHRAAALEGGIFSDETCTNTRVVDGACIFLNRVDHPGGAGCALHLGALAAGESPVDWKPSVCWQLPVKVDWEMRDDDVEVATVRGWQRRDWGADGEAMAWCCTEGPEAYVGDRPGDHACPAGRVR